MPSCREIDPLFAPYIDGEATADQRAIVDAHLVACPKCRHHTALQSAVPLLKLARTVTLVEIDDGSAKTPVEEAASNQAPSP